MSRADKQTYKNQKPEYYSDFMINLDLNPVTGQLARVINEEEIKQSVRMCILTQIGERPYSVFGSKVTASLFDNIDGVTEEQLKVSVQTALQFEPRVLYRDCSMRIENNTVMLIVAVESTTFPDRLIAVPIVIRNVR